MKILFLVKFYYPFDRGGSEWSTRDLAKLLKKSGHEVIIVTPNYGSLNTEKIDNILIQRMPFPIKLKTPKSKIAPYWTNNIVWFIYSSIIVLIFCIRHKIDIVHVHSNEFIPATVITKIIIKKPSVVTFRDYQSLCSLGFCLWYRDKTCKVVEFITGDFRFFYKNYITDKNPVKLLLLFAAALRAMVMQKIIYYFAKKIDYKITVSKKVAQIFKTNGIKDTKVIHNPVLITTNTTNNYSKEILYVGKFSKGKGVDILMSLMGELIKLIPDAEFKFIGSGYLEKEFKKQIAADKMKLRLKLMGHVFHDEVLKEIKKAGIVIVPSVWQEPLPRSAIEAVESGTPVVATNVGGIPEIVKNGIYGLVANPEKESIKKAIITGYRNKERYRENIKRDLLKIRHHFSQEVLEKYLEIYMRATNA